MHEACIVLTLLQFFAQELANGKKIRLIYMVDGSLPLFLALWTSKAALYLGYAAHSRSIYGRVRH